ncbi:hypothetical protein [Catenuloplanes atrovinosus]|uniref:Uncharacterized protein n=1 Tax=Catenuloplanes atrovinosus TaxID=137266 RepID=A0AAE3YP89_9ACTN|nr:hypothetical protein [Catenuloplanes atrovinosus]MDR7276667.1 hypothetical protein [Catenuloplanes atrovinosus]
MESRRRYVERAASGPGYLAIVGTAAVVVGVVSALLEAWAPW